MTKQTTTVLVTVITHIVRPRCKLRLLRYRGTDKTGCNFEYSRVDCTGHPTNKHEMRAAVYLSSATKVKSNYSTIF